MFCAARTLAARSHLFQGARPMSFVASRTGSPPSTLHRRCSSACIPFGRMYATSSRSSTRIRSSKRCRLRFGKGSSTRRASAADVWSAVSGLGDPPVADAHQIIARLVHVVNTRSRPQPRRLRHWLLVAGLPETRIYQRPQDSQGVGPSALLDSGPSPVGKRTSGPDT